MDGALEGSLMTSRLCTSWGRIMIRFTECAHALDLLSLDPGPRVPGN